MSNIADLACQVTATTGTGAYTVSGTVDNRRTFLQAFPADTASIPCVIVDVAGNYETGFYAWDHTALTLTRTTIVASSNGNAAVSWAAGSKQVYCGPFAGTSALVALRHNFAAAAVPSGPSPQTTAGYGIGSFWLTTTGALYIGVALSGTDVVFDRMPLLDGSANLAVAGAMSSALANGWALQYSNSGYTAAGGYLDPDGGMASFCDGFNIAMYGRTSNATPKNIAFNDDAAGSILPGVEDGAAMRISAIVVATVDGGATKEWEVIALVKSLAGTTTIVGQTATSSFSTGTVTGWAVAVVSPSANKITLQVTGAAATEITWGAQIRGVHAGRQ